MDLQTGNNQKCPGCDRKQNNKIQIKFRKCLSAAAQVNAKNLATVTTLQEAQNYTCILISDMNLCHSNVPLRLCYSEKEIENMIDVLISKQISEYGDNNFGIKVEECNEVKGFLESGRADNLNKTVQVACSAKQVNDGDIYDCN